MRFSKLPHIIFHIFIIILCVAPLLLRAADDSSVLLLEQPADPSVFKVEQSSVVGGLLSGRKATSRKDQVKKPRAVARKRALALEAMEQEKPLIFLVHGAKALRESWYRPRGDFYEELSAQGRLAGLGEVVPVSWSGKSGPPEGRLASVQAHIKAAQDLVETILERTKGRSRRFVLIGHSYGGAISMLVTHMLFNPLVQQKRPQELFEKLSESDANYRLLIECREQIQAAVEEQQARWTANETPFVVERLFTIATPVDTALYTANMNVVKNLYVLSSAGDKVQSFFGKRRYKGAVNMRVAMESINRGVYYPLHTKMRNVIMARYLLSLPVRMEKAFGTNLTQLKGIDVLLPERNVEPMFRKIESFSARSFKAAGF